VLPRYYADAIEESELDVIAAPTIDITSGEDDGPVVFDAVVEIRPEVAIPGHDGLVVTLPNPHATDEEINVQLDASREQFATLSEVARPARDGDLVTLDVHGTRDGKAAEGLTADDLVYQVGTGGIVAGIDERLFGAKVGEIFEMDAPDAPGGPANLRVLIKQVREKILPELSDAFASDASEFDTLEELKVDLATRISSVKRIQASFALRERAIEALVGLVVEDPPPTLVAEESEHLLEDLVHRLTHQKIKFEEYVSATGKTLETLRAEIEAQAVMNVKADLALRALAQAESIEVDESDLDEEIARLANQAGKAPGVIRTMLDQNGRMAGLRSQLKNAKAMSWLTAHVEIVDEEGNPVDREEFKLDAIGELSEAEDVHSVSEDPQP
jgi:trigger factor